MILYKSHLYSSFNEKKLAKKVLHYFFLQQWLEGDFLKFLTKWEQEKENQADINKKEKKQLCLSRETLEGLGITDKF